MSIATTVAHDGQVLGLVDLEVLLGEVELALRALERVLRRAHRVDARDSSSPNAYGRVSGRRSTPSPAARIGW